MNRTEEVKEIYENTMLKLSDKAYWLETLKGISRYYKFSFTEALLINTQNPEVDTLTDYHVWNKLNRQIKAGEKSIAVFSDVNNIKLRYLFDIRQTKGAAIKQKWELTDDVLLTVSERLNLSPNINEFFTEIIEKSYNVWYNENINLFPHFSKDNNYTALFKQSVLCIVSSRCGYTADCDFTGIELIQPPKRLVELGELAMSLAKSALLTIENEIKIIEKEKVYGKTNNNAVSRITGDRDNIRIGRERSIQSGTEGRGTGGAVISESENGTSILDGDRQIRFNNTEYVRSDDKNIPEDRRTYAGDKSGGNNSDEISNDFERGFSNESVTVDGNRHISGTQDDGVYAYGSGTLIENDRYHVSGGIESVGLSDDEVIKYVLMRGSSFADGKFRIEDFAKSEPSTSDFAKYLSKEYGIGGSSIDEGFFNHDGKGIKIDLYDRANGEYQKSRSITLNWNKVAKRISELVRNGEYITDYDIQLRIRNAKFAIKNCDPEDNFDMVKAREAIEILALYNLTDNDETIESVSVENEQLNTDEFEDEQYDDFYSLPIAKETLDFNTEQLGFESNHSTQTQLELVQTEQQPDGKVEKKETESEPVVDMSDEPEIKVIDKPKNFRYSDEYDIYPAGKKAKYNNNILAIKTLKRIENEHRAAVPDEQIILARYVGWGGLSKAFEKNTSEYIELKTLLTDEEFKSAMESTLTAYYTDPKIIEQIYNAIGNFGFNGGEILDPAMGTGNFYANLPAGVMNNSNLHGVEIDSITGRISKLLFPNSDVQIKGFEYTNYNNDTFDIVIGNVPFNNFAVLDREYKDDMLIHDYFFVKSLDKLKPGGILAFITSKGTMDKSDSSIREKIAEKADLIGAVRLPNNAFKAIAGTEVTTDILFFKKVDKARDLDNYTNPDWIYTGYNKGSYMRINRYFIDNPNMILGEMKDVKTAYGWDTACIPIKDEDLYSSLNTALSTLKADFTAVPTTKSEDEIDGDEVGELRIKADEGTKKFAYVIKDDKLYYNDNGYLEISENLPKKKEQRIKGMCTVATALEKVINIQLKEYQYNDLELAQKELNEAYDEFVSKHGYINTTANTAAFSDDVRQPLLLSIELEVKDNDTVRYEKSAIFTKATIKSYAYPDTAASAHEALLHSLGRKAQVDLNYMARLYCADKGISEAKDIIIEELGDKIYLNPVKFYGDKYIGWETCQEYLSGDVRDKLRLAESKAKEFPELFERNVDALKSVQPADVGINDIDFSIGTIYIPVEFYNNFIHEVFETRTYNINTKNGIEVMYNEVLNQWLVTNKSSERSVILDESYGTSRINAYNIFEQTLNLQHITIKDPYTYYDISGEEKVGYKVNVDETTLAREKQTQIQRVFKEWILSDDERVQTIEKIYNERYNNIKPREFNGDYLIIPGMSETEQLRPHQKDVVDRVINTGTALIAHEVGAGKTAAMVAAGMYLRNIGACKKALYVVPNSIVDQWGKEFLRFFPSANVLVTTKKDFEKKNRQRFLSKIASGDFDAIIISQSQFEKIPISLERQEKQMREKISRISKAIEEFKLQHGKSAPSVKEMATQKKRLSVQLSKLIANWKKDDFLTFESLGVDFLFVDEAHNYKNLFLFTKMRNVAGINNSNSQRAMDMEMKCRYLQEINGGKGVVFATGTPISNSMSELFIMQNYLQPNTLKRVNADMFDNWASIFGKSVTAHELKPTGSGFRMKTRFAKFHNIPELCNIFSEVFDIKTTAELNLDVPKLKDDKPIMVICEKSPEQEEQVEIGLERAKRVENKAVTPEQDNMLAICTYMTKVALDARINDSSASDFGGSKINKCAENIIGIYNDNPNSSQVVFCDTSTPKKDVFNVYDALKESLINKGISADEIAFIHEADTDEKKARLFEKVNNADIKVIIGSTEKLGTGVNIQRKLIAAHHLDCPYRPSDLNQRNGRIVRQFNENSEVSVYYYATKGTFDSYRWQIVEKKQNFIAQIMSGKPVSRSFEDIDDTALTFAEMKAAATENPYLARKLNVDNEVNRLILLQNEWTKKQKRLNGDINYYPGKIRTLTENLSNINSDIETLKPTKDSEEFSIIIGDNHYSDRAEAGKALMSAIMQTSGVVSISSHFPETAAGEYRDMNISFVKNAGFPVHIYLSGKHKYSVDMSMSDIGNITKIENLAERITGIRDNTVREIEYYNKQLENAKLEIAKPFEYSQELIDLLSEQSEINTLLEFGSDDEEDEVVSSDDELDEEIG